MPLRRLHINRVESQLFANTNANEKILAFTIMPYVDRDSILNRSRFDLQSVRRLLKFFR